MSPARAGDDVSPAVFPLHWQAAAWIGHALMHLPSKREYKGELEGKAMLE